MLSLTLAGLLKDAATPLRDALYYVDAEAPDELAVALSPLARNDSPERLETSGYVIHSLQYSTMGYEPQTPRRQL